MVPLSRSSADSESRHARATMDSWYIGAFGKWWRGGIFEEWYQDVIARSKDEESWSSGILSMKRLDLMQEYNAPTFSAKNLPAHLAPGSPPRLRNRERPTLKTSSVHPRSASPPPLPKSASLPMHSVRSVGQVRSPPHAPPCINSNSEASRRVTAPPTRPSSAPFDQSPLIAEVLRQINNAKASVHDLRTQLSECQTGATQSRAVLQLEVDSHRERKRQEDTAKSELKSRTKTLEDGKRSAEGLKKDADKRLKAAHTLRDNATQRLTFLDSRTAQLQRELAQNRDFLASHRGLVSDQEREIVQALEDKRNEIKAAEEQIQAINLRSREIEDKVNARKERLRILRQKVDGYSQQLNATPALPSAVPLDSPQLFYEPQITTWPGVIHSPVTASPLQAHPHSQHWHLPSDTIGNVRRQSHDNHSPHHSPSEGAPNSHVINSTSTVENAGHNKGHHQHPFYPSGSGGLEYASSGLSHGHGHGHSPDSPYRTSSDLNVVVDGPLRSPIALSNTSHNGKGKGNNLGTSAHHNAEAANGSSSLGSYAGYHQTSPSSHRQLAAGVTDKAWLSGSGSGFGGVTGASTGAGSGKSLNPDAREFNLNLFNGTTYDALNPHGFASSTSSTTSHSLLRAFAPSPAEREALHRALGGSSNASFEMLPSLSDVGSIPASPTAQTQKATSPSGGSMVPGWLHSLPKTRKVNFSPWDDDEPVQANGSRKL